jgi:predicted GTPase
LGATGCGKSALVSRFMDKNVYLSAYHETLVDNYTQLMFMLDTKGVRNRKVNLHILDVGHRWVRPQMIKE